MTPTVTRLSAAALLVSTCACSGMNWNYTDVQSVVSSGSDVVKAATLSDEDVKEMALAFSKTADSKYKVAPASSAYAKRMQKIIGKHKSENGQPLEFKVYLSKEVNAFALANGSIRIHSGLLDMMNDDEVRFVVGHEIGHVMEGHSKNAMRTAYAASAARKGVASQYNSTAGALANSVVGEMLEEVVNAQFSQSQERAADDYGLQFLKKHGYNQRAAVSALKKLAKLGDESGILQSHPAPSDRAERIQEQIGKNVASSK